MGWHSGNGLLAVDRGTVVDRGKFEEHLRIFVVQLFLLGHGTLDSGFKQVVRVALVAGRFTLLGIIEVVLHEV